MLLRFLDLIENIALWAGCAALLAMGALVTGSVIGRGLFNTPIPDDLLMIGLLMVCVIILPLGYVERGDGHITVTVISDRLPRAVQTALKIAGRLIFAAFLGTMGVILARKISSELEQGLYYDGQLDVPTWPMKAVFAFGVAVFVLRLAINIVRDLRGTTPTPGSQAH